MDRSNNNIMDNLYFLSVFHLSMVKGVYNRQKRWKGSAEQADNLALICLLMLCFSLFVFLIDKELLLDLVRRRVFVGWKLTSLFSIFLMPLLFYLYSRRLTPRKIGIIKKVIIFQWKIKRVYSIVYVCFYTCLFLVSIFVGILKMHSCSI